MKKLLRIRKYMIGILALVCMLTFVGAGAVNAAEVKLNKGKASIVQYGSVQLKLKNTQGKVRWTSSDPNIAKVSKKGLVSGVAGGSCIITASCAEKKYTCSVTVKGVALNKKVVHLKKGKTYQLKLLNATKRLGKISWKSSNKKVASVNTAGKVKGVSNGVSTLTATYKKKKFQCKVYVSDTEISVNYPELELKRLQEVQLKLNGADAKVKWVSSDVSVATVTPDGLVKGMNAGTCAIYTEYNEVTYYCFVTVPYTFSSSDKIVLAGSSTMDYWRNHGDKTAFSPHQIINVGIAGTTATQWLGWEDSKIVANNPKAVVIYVGANDIGAGGNGYGKTTSDMVIRLLGDLKRKMPKVPIFYVSVAMNYARQSAWPNVKACNQYVSAYCDKTPDVYYIDVVSRLLKGDGTPDESLFSSDKLHHNDAGYAVWKTVVAQAVKSRIK